MTVVFLIPLTHPVALAGPPSDDNNVFVKGFDRSQGEEAVREALTTLFSDAGEVANVRLPTDRETGELKGFGFIEFADNAGKVRAQGIGCLLYEVERQL